MAYTDLTINTQIPRGSGKAPGSLAAKVFFHQAVSGENSTLDGLIKERKSIYSEVQGALSSCMAGSRSQITSSRIYLHCFGFVFLCDGLTFILEKKLNTRGKASLFPTVPGEKLQNSLYFSWPSSQGQFLI